MAEKVGSSGSAAGGTVPEQFRVMVADDDESVRELVGRLLKREGFEVVTAVDGEQAWHKMRSHDIDLVVTDVQMPGRSGHELLENLRAEHPSVPVILITGMPTVEAAVECMKIGAFDYITKPFDLTKLRDRVWAALRQRKASPTTGVGGAQPGGILAGYRVIKTLGEGSVGVVFLVDKRDDRSEQKYALKILKLGGVSKLRREKLLLRFLHEGEAVSKIVHPNVIRFVEYGLAREENIPYLVMEYFSAPTLQDVLPEMQQLSYAEKVAVVCQAAKGLDAVHAQGVCHRDIKPANIMIDRKRLSVKISDFGIALLPDSDLTNPAHLIGTPAYMAPEAFISSHVDHLADIFSLGVVAYELFLGQRPFTGENVQMLARQIPKVKPLAPRKLDLNFPLSLEAILARMLKKSPERRYASVAEVLTDLTAFLENDSGEATVWHRLAERLSGDWS